MATRAGTEALRRLADRPVVCVVASPREPEPTCSPTSYPKRALHFFTITKTWSKEATVFNCNDQNQQRAGHCKHCNDQKQLT